MAQVYKNKSFNSISACYRIHTYIHRRMGNSLRGREREREREREIVHAHTQSRCEYIHFLRGREPANFFLKERERVQRLSSDLTVESITSTPPPISILISIKKNYFQTSIVAVCIYNYCTTI